MLFLIITTYGNNYHNAPIYADIIQRIINNESELKSVFQITKDIASIRLKNYLMAKHICAIFRESVNSIEENTYPANFLYEYSLLKGERVLVTFFRRCFKNDTDKIYNFFLSYIKVILRAPIILLIKYGIAIEPHLQNSFIAFDNNFLPKKLILRDIDGININMNILSTEINLKNYNFHPLTKFSLKNDKFSATKVWHSLIYNHLAELIKILVEAYNFDEKILWTDSRRCIDQVVDSLKGKVDHIRIRTFNNYFLSSNVNTKAMLKMKVLNTEFFHMVQIHNPLNL